MLYKWHNIETRGASLFLVLVFLTGCTEVLDLWRRGCARLVARCGRHGCQSGTCIVFVHTTRMYCLENSSQTNALSVLVLYWHHVCLLCQSAVRVKLVAVQVVSDVLGHGIDFDAVITRLVLIGRLVY